jgi:reverse transcriptase-like protein
MRYALSRRSFVTALGTLGGLAGLDLSTAWARPILFSRVTDPSVANAIDLSIRNVARDGLNNFFPTPFEVQLLAERADLREAVFDNACTRLVAQELRESDFSQLHLIEFPKRQYGNRRICAIMEPIDSIVYLGLVLMAAEAIERNRIHVRERVVHSFRYRPARMSGRLFDSRFSYVTFLKDARRRRGVSDFLVNCDIADFFGSVSPESVDRALADAGVAQSTNDHIVSLLRLWSKGGAKGLPVGPNASKILAEAVLCRTDRLLQAQGVEFVRYVDDFKLIAPDRATAESHAQILAAVLDENGLKLNADKTEFVEPMQIASKPLPRFAANYERDAPPRQFKIPTPKEIKRLRKRTSYRPNPDYFLAGDLLPVRKARRAIRMAICTAQSDFLRALPAILERYPEFSRYVSLGLVYATDLIPVRVRRDLSRYAASAILNDGTPRFAKLDYLRLMGEPGFVQRSALLRYARTADAQSPEFRAAVDALRKSGGIPANLISRYHASDRWGRRALALHSTRPRRVDDSDPFLSILV